MTKDIKRLDLNTPDGAQLNMDALYQIAPSVFTESRDEKTGELKRVVNFDALRQLLGDNAVDEGSETYEFRWVGKDAAKAEAARVIDKTLRPVVEDSVDWDNTKNLYIEGDNLEVLKLLQRSYMGKVKMIYIDPPYNTGNDFVYHDDFDRSKYEEELASGAIDELGLRYLKSSENDGQFHSNWCSMIYSRLMVARSLLSEDGVIFISIDDNEVDNLRKICDEVFGANNFVAQMIWEQGRKSMAAQIAVNHEYCVIYNKCRSNAIELSTNSKYEFWKTKKQGLAEIYDEYERLKSLHENNFTAIEKGMRSFYKSLPDSNPSKAHSHYKNVDKKGLFFAGDISQGTGNGGRFDILHPVTHCPCKVPNGGWRFGISKLQFLLDEDRIYFGPDEKTVPCLKRYLRETEYEVMSSVFYKDGRGASKRIDSLFNHKNIFPYPKDEDIIQTFVKATVENNKDSIILDFFSGSATTAHAVMQLNAEDGGNRKFIMVQLPELTDEDSEAYKAGYDNICEIGEERIRRAGEKIKKEHPEVADTLDTGFRIFYVDDSNFNPGVKASPGEYNQQQLDLFADNIKSDRNDLDLLFGSILAWGLQLDLPMETEEVDGCKIYTVNDGDLVACFAQKVTDKVIEAMAEKEPLRVLFRDSCFDSDDKKINLFETFKQKLDWTDDEAFNNIRVI